MPRYSIGRSQIVESTGHVTPAERIEWARERYRLARKAAFAAHFRDPALNAAAEGRKRELEELERALTALPLTREA